MKNTRLKIMLAPLLFSAALFAQKGLPPSQDTKSTQVTNYPTMMEFSPSLVNDLKVPSGWKVSVAASGLGKPRMMYTGPNGELYVTRRDAGDVLLLKDTNKDNKFDELSTVVAEFPGVHGIAVNEGYMYLCNNNKLVRYKMNNDGTLGKQADTIANNLPSGGQHGNRTMHFGPDKMLYLSVGSTCNDCKEGDKETAAMLQIDTKTGKRKLYASGLRNTIGFDFHPKTGEMWGIDNGSDTKGDNWPPEELNKIVMDGNYGFPFAYAKQEVDQSREDPVGNTKENYAKATKPSVLEFQAHSAPIEFKFFNSTASGFNGDGLVCWHGSWNRSAPVGFKVERIIFKDGVATGSEDFLTGFLKGDKRFGRPAGLAITAAGEVYVSDDANGVIYCIKKA
jgi:glucose/arabinose dehydrogenase